MSEEEKIKMMDDHYDQLIEEENKTLNMNIKLLDQVEQIQSKDYREDVEACLNEAETQGIFSFVDVSMLNPKHRQEEDWLSFDHIYVDQQIDGGYTGDEFGGYIFVPITKKLYLCSYYSM